MVVDGGEHRGAGTPKVPLYKGQEHELWSERPAQGRSWVPTAQQLPQAETPRPGMGAALPTVSSPGAHRPPTTAAPHRWKLALKCLFLSSRKSDYISPLDDLAFDMYQDPEVAQIIRKLDERKREAVQKERYDYAKKLKQAIADLQKVLLLGKPASCAPG